MSKRACALMLLLAYVVATFAGCAAAPTVPPVVPALPTSAAAGATTIVAVAPPAAPCCPKQTLWDFLGVTQLGKALGGGFSLLRNRLGSRFPGLEAKPPLRSLTDPANMGPDASPAEKAAAEAKANEDKAAQKAKAIRYLAKLGCTDCYPDTEKALLAALDDCSEVVRYEAVLAIRELAGGPCVSCKNNRCCSPAITKKLQEIAGSTNDQGCYKETSPRVRRIARLALLACPGASAPADGPQEGPADAPLPLEPTPAVAAGGATRRMPAVESTIATASAIQALPGAPQGPASSGLVLATVNGEPIYEHEVLGRLAGSALAANPSPLRAELERAIEQRVLLQGAQRDGYRPGAPYESRQVSYAEGAMEPPEPLSDVQIIREWLNERVPVDRQVSRSELFGFYRNQMHRFQPPAEVRWELLETPLNRHATLAAAQATMNHLRERARGQKVELPTDVSLAHVSAKAVEWTAKQQLPSTELQHWLFTLPVGTLSPLLYDENRVFMVRVLERRQARAVPIEEAQQVIAEEIVAQRRDQATRNFVAQLRREARVWTVFDTAAAR